MHPGDSLLFVQRVHDFLRLVLALRVEDELQRGSLLHSNGLAVLHLFGVIGLLEDVAEVLGAEPLLGVERRDDVGMLNELSSVFALFLTMSEALGQEQ